MVIRGSGRLSGLGFTLAIPLLNGVPALVVASTAALLALGWFVMVVIPAVWSKDEKRRSAALAVLNVFRKS